MRLKISYTYNMSKLAEGIFRKLYDYHKQYGLIRNGQSFRQWLKEYMYLSVEERVVYLYEEAQEELTGCYDFEDVDNV